VKVAQTLSLHSFVLAFAGALASPLAAISEEEDVLECEDVQTVRDVHTMRDVYAADLLLDALPTDCATCGKHRANVIFEFHSGGREEIDGLPPDCATCDKRGASVTFHCHSGAV